MSGTFAHELLDAAKEGDRQAAERLIQENSGLIWSIARRYFGRGVDGDDLYQLGCIGFLKAIQSYDAEYGTRFSTYAVPKIAGEIRRFLRDDGTVKVSRGLKERAQFIRAARISLEQKLGREPQLSEISEETGLTVEDIAVAETAVSAACSLTAHSPSKESGDDGLALEDVLSDTFQEDRMIEYVSLREAISSLPERERQVIALRYFRGMTQERAARVMKVSQVQVSRLERKAVESLKKFLTG
jgi:RNA polymerase sporulation-specific sigma factor